MMATIEENGKDIAEHEESRSVAEIAMTFKDVHKQDADYEYYCKAAVENETNMTEFEDIRVNIVGSYGQGKTSLARRLLGENNTVSNSTDGISISNGIRRANTSHWERKEIDFSPEELTDSSTSGKNAAAYQSDKQHKNTIEESSSECRNVSIWDFAGQYVYYATHQIFHSSKALYLLVFDLSQGLDELVFDEDYPSETRAKTREYFIKFWIHSIHAFLGSSDGIEPIVILVGTHKDLLKSKNEADSYFEHVRECFNGSTSGVHIHPENFAVSLTEPLDDTITQLQNTILELGRERTENCKISKKWISFKQAILANCADKIITFEKILQIDCESKIPIGDTLEIKKCLSFFHETGHLLYVDEGEIAEYVIVDPNFVVDAFKCVIFSKRFLKSSAELRPLRSNLFENAILDEKLLQHVWTEENGMRKHKAVLIGYLKHYRIVAEAQMFNKDWRAAPLGYFIVPSLNQKSDDGHIVSFLNGKPCTVVSVAFQFESEALVIALYPKVTAGAVGTWPILKFKGTGLFFENAACYKINYCHAGLIMKSRDKLELLVISLCPEEEISPEMSNNFRGFVELIVGQEFRRYRNEDRCSLETVPFTETVRCWHKVHSFEGSIDSYDLDMLRMVKGQGAKKISCPDHVSHASLSLDKIFQEWFDYKSIKRETRVPKIKLTEKEFLILSKAVGSEWELLVLELGVSDVKLQQIKMDIPSTQMRIYKLFLEWNESFTDEATFDVLVKAFGAIPPYSVNWDIVNDLIRQKLE